MLFVDTNGNTKLDDELINLTDKFMLDVKSIDEKENIWLTKSSNKLVLENLKKILELDKMYEVRTVIAKGLNSEKQWMKFLKSLVINVDINL